MSTSKSVRDSFKAYEHYDRLNNPDGKLDIRIHIGEAQPKFDRKGNPVYIKGLVSNGKPVQDTCRKVAFISDEGKWFFEKTLSSGQVNYLMSGFAKKLGLKNVKNTEVLEYIVNNCNQTVYAYTDAEYGLQISATEPRF